MKKRYVYIALTALMALLLAACSSDSKSTNETAEVAEMTEAVAETEASKESVGGADIEDFTYELSGDEVIIKRYNGEQPIAEIMSEYMIDGEPYKTNLMDFSAMNKNVDIWIFDEGITEISMTAFNSTGHHKAIFYPLSMSIIYDYALAYMNPEEGEKIQIYYAGSDDDWDSIFTIYEIPDVSDAESPEELGSAMAAKLNQFIGHHYDSEDFEYHFNATPDDLKSM